MKFELVRFGDHFRLVKGASYSSKNLVEESDTGLLTINAFLAGGGYKPQSEKPFHGDVRAEHLLSNGDVLIAMTEQDEGLLGSPLVVHKGRTDYEDLLFSLDVAKPVATTGEIEPEFVFNVLRIPAFRKRAAYGDTGSTVQRLPYDAIGDLKIPKPPLPTQRAINRLAAAIDKKIWLNSRMADNLEKLSESVFKSWFVDFDPVKAKMAGEAPVGMDEETAALFPDSVEETEFGTIPNGWRHGTLGEMALAKKGTSITRASSIEGDIPVVAGGLEPAYFHNKSNVNAPVVTISASGANAGFVRLYGQDIWASDCSFFSRGETPHVFFVYSFLKHHQERIFGMQQGAAQPHIYSSDLARLTGFFPSEVRILDAFERTVAPLFESQEANRHQNSTLSEIRDALLPRLISGELEIPEEMLAA